MRSLVLTILVMALLAGCSERELARAASDWCRLNPDCDHHGEAAGDRPAAKL